jgi:hypothetical protein
MIRMTGLLGEWDRTEIIYKIEEQIFSPVVYSIYGLQLQPVLHAVPCLQENCWKKLYLLACWQYCMHKENFLTTAQTKKQSLLHNSHVTIGNQPQIKRVEILSTEFNFISFCIYICDVLITVTTLQFGLNYLSWRPSFKIQDQMVRGLLLNPNPS